MIDARPILGRSPVIPVVTLPDVRDAAALGYALADGGIDVVEVTLRSAAGIAAIAELRSSCPGLYIGAGTVWTQAQAVEAIAAGAQFIVSPGFADPVLAECSDKGVPYLPGIQTVTETARLVQRGARAVKFFPAAVAGGPAALRAFAAVFPGLAFCPTGGITLETAADYLALDCVPCVGGGWLTPDAALAARDWDAIRTAAVAASKLAVAREARRCA
ncbi:MAG TPA: bifunctional 4-hydroxy-2-oxoglutarate aldolase/2-dehydro-3-deoxy-phosphogluconate aldolase [Gammaproteobacteria bacterium]|nr:bifunctional 4-hydroxy-2-oxoglutarate aldolase/2-dehydro-3-deoxy-phosphogluconate aldolase [Gammaproteobacteria bacterium]